MLAEGGTESPFDYYACVFDLPDRPSDILDIGSGKACGFARDNTNPHRVVSLNPQLNRIDRRESARAPYPLYGLKATPDVLAVAGLAQCLPFADQSFDMAVSANAVPHYAHTSDWMRIYQEAVRVLRPGGCAQFYPAFPQEDPALTGLAAQGLEVSIDQLEDPLEMRLPADVRPGIKLPGALLFRLTIIKPE